MGLDWNLLSRPKPGNEREFEQLVREVRDGKVPRRDGLLARLLGPRRLSEREEKERLARIQAISDPPYALLGAPRVGFDATADEWLRDQLRARGKLADLDDERQKMHGYYVLDLLPPCDGFPLYTNYSAYEGLERYSFRAAFLKDVREIIEPDLHDQAWNRMLASELEAYAAALEAKARPWAERAGVIAIADATEPPPFMENDPATQAHILFSAIRWCRFWAARGHGLEPWF